MCAGGGTSSVESGVSRSALTAVCDESSSDPRSEMDAKSASCVGMSPVSLGGAAHPRPRREEYQRGGRARTISLVSQDANSSRGPALSM